MKRIIPLCLALIPFLSMGQAIRLNVYGKSYMMKDASNNRYIGLGYEQNLSTKLAFKDLWSCLDGLCSYGDSAQCILWAHVSGSRACMALVIHAAAGVMCGAECDCIDSCMDGRSEGCKGQALPWNVALMWLFTTSSNFCLLQRSLDRIEHIRYSPT